MKRSFFALLTIVVVLAQARAWAEPEEQWIEVQSSHFNVLTDGGERPGRDLGQQFEQMRSSRGWLRLLAKAWSSKYPLRQMSAVLRCMNRVVAYSVFSNWFPL